MSYKELRCPNDRPHGKYGSCGKFMGAAEISASPVFVICSKCGILWQVALKDEIPTYTAMTDKIDTETSWRQVDLGENR